MKIEFYIWQADAYGRSYIIKDIIEASDIYDEAAKEIKTYIDNVNERGDVFDHGEIVGGDLDGRNIIDVFDLRDCFEKSDETKETVNHPSHYNSGKFEVIDIIEEFGKEYKGGSAFDFGNIVKYILRAKNKNGLEDLKKARWYLDRLIERWED